MAPQAQQYSTMGLKDEPNEAALGKDE